MAFIPRVGPTAAVVLSAGAAVIAVSACSFRTNAPKIRAALGFVCVAMFTLALVTLSIKLVEKKRPNCKAASAKVPPAAKGQARSRDQMGGDGTTIGPMIEGFRDDALWPNEEKIQDDWNPRTNGTIYTSCPNAFSGYAYYDTASA